MFSTKNSVKGLSQPQMHSPWSPGVEVPGVLSKLFGGGYLGLQENLEGVPYFRVSLHFYGQPFQTLPPYPWVYLRIYAPISNHRPISVQTSQLLQVRTPKHKPKSQPKLKPKLAQLLNAFTNLLVVVGALCCFGMIFPPLTKIGIFSSGASSSKNSPPDSILVLFSKTYQVPSGRYPVTCVAP